MKKFVSLLLVSVMLAGLLSTVAYADWGDLGGLMDALTQEDPDMGDVMDGLSGLLGGGKSSDSDKKTDAKTEEEDELPSLIGPFSGNTVKVKAGKKTYTVHVEFKDAMDKYEAYFDSYIDFTTHIDAPDYLARYADFMKKYMEVAEAMEKLDKMSDKEKGWTKDEDAYFTYVMLEIDKKLIDATGNIN